MATYKFSEDDRKQVISKVESVYGLKLSRIENYRKYLQDNSGQRYIILGGYGDWHGIDKNIFFEEEKGRNNTLLIIAKCSPNHIDIYSGNFSIILNNKKRLTVTGDGRQYEFNLITRPDRLLLREIPSMVLNKICQIP